MPDGLSTVAVISTSIAPSPAHNSATDVAQKQSLNEAEKYPAASGLNCEEEAPGSLWSCSES